MIITDDMVQRSVRARMEHEHGPVPDDVWQAIARTRKFATDRAALEAVAPLIGAAYLRRAADELGRQGVVPWDRNLVAIQTLRFCADIEAGSHE